VEEPIASNEERINAVGQLGRDLLGGVPRVDQDVEVASSDHAGSGKLKSLRTIGAVGDRDDLPHLIRLAGWRGSSARGKTAAVVGDLQRPVQLLSLEPEVIDTARRTIGAAVQRR